jgi:uncharacterized membrane protein
MDWYIVFSTTSQAKARVTNNNQKMTAVKAVGITMCSGDGRSEWWRTEAVQRLVGGR